jgi:NOL1/NOP2/fmu family ribosome biogenesis protein
MRDQGLLVANELYPARAKVLAENLERWGARRAVITSAAPEQLADRFGAYFHCIVVDAPCSGEGMFRKDPEASSYWSVQHVQECALLQADILQSAYRLLLPGGRLVYSTCTFAPEENERNIARFLREYPDMQLLPARLHESWRPGLKQGNVHTELTARLWPHRLTGEGHFLALLQKAGGDNAIGPKETEPILRKVPPGLAEFQVEALRIACEGPFIQYGDWLYLAPLQMLPDLAGIRVLRPGWPLGELRKGRFIPSHALALGLRQSEAKLVCDLPAGGDLVLAYLQGHTLRVDLPNGWTLVTVDGFPLGWGKVVNGVLKNHYPKGLRWL